MTPELNWAGQPIREGEGYGGRPENIPETWGQPLPLAKPAVKHYEVITAEDVAEVFGFGEYELPRALAAKLLEEFTGTHWTTAYRALRLNGRFALHLRAAGRTLFWRSL